MCRIINLKLSLLSLLLVASSVTKAKYFEDDIREARLSVSGLLKGYVANTENSFWFSGRENAQEDDHNVEVLFTQKAELISLVGELDRERSSNIKKKISNLRDDFKEQIHDFMRFKRCYTPVSDCYDRNVVKALEPLESMSITDFFRVTKNGVTKLGTKKRSIPSVTQIDAFSQRSIFEKVFERLYRENIMPFYETANVQRFVVQRIQDKLLTPRFKKYLKAVRVSSLVSAQVEENLVESMVARATHYLSTRDQEYFENIMMRKGLAL